MEMNSDKPPSKTRVNVLLFLVTAFNFGVMGKFIYDLILAVGSGSLFRASVSLAGIAIIGWVLHFLLSIWWRKLRPNPNKRL